MSADIKTAVTQNRLSATPGTLVPLLEYLLSESRSDRRKKMANIMIWGGMGIGKTDIARQFAKKINYYVVALHLPQYDPTDMKGVIVRMEDGSIRWMSSTYLPQQKFKHVVNSDGTITIDWPNYNNDRDIWVRVVQNGKNVFIWNNEARYPGKNDINLKVEVEDLSDGTKKVHVTGTLEKGMVVYVAEKAILFLDELSAADPTTQNAALQLVLDRRINEYELPEGTPIIAAGNREGDGAFVQQMSLPLANRFCHVTLEPDVEDAIYHWASLGAHPAICGFVKNEGSRALYGYNPDEMSNGDYGFRTPRSWMALDEQLDPKFLSYLTGTDSDEITTAEFNMFKLIIHGYIGSEYGNKFVTHLRVINRLPSTDDILTGKVKKLPPSVERTSHFTLVIMLTYKLKDYFQKLHPKMSGGDQGKWEETVTNYLKFIDVELGKELSMFVINLLQIIKLELNDMRCAEMISFCDKYLALKRRLVNP